MSVEVNSQLEARDLRYSHALCPIVTGFGSLMSRVLGIIKRYVDLLETRLVAIGLDPALMARGPTAAVLGLVVSALMHLIHEMAAP